MTTAITRRRLAITALAALLLADVVWGKGGGCDSKVTR